MVGFPVICPTPCPVDHHQKVPFLDKPNSVKVKISSCSAKDMRMTIRELPGVSLQGPYARNVDIRLYKQKGASCSP